MAQQLECQCAGHVDTGDVRTGTPLFVCAECTSTDVVLCDACMRAGLLPPERGHSSKHRLTEEYGQRKKKPRFKSFRGRTKESPEEEADPRSGREVTQEDTIDAYLPFLQVRRGIPPSEAGEQAGAYLCVAATRTRELGVSPMGGGSRSFHGKQLANLIRVVSYSLEQIAEDAPEVPDPADDDAEEVSPMERIGRALSWLDPDSGSGENDGGKAEAGAVEERDTAAALLLSVRSMLPKSIVMSLLTHDVLELRAAMLKTLRAVLEGPLTVAVLKSDSSGITSDHATLILEDLGAGLAPDALVQIVSAVAGEEGETKDLQKWLLANFRSWVAAADEHDSAMAETTLGDDLIAFLSRQEFCDVTFTCADGVKVGGHECIIVVRCPLLAEMINAQGGRTDDGEPLNFEVSVESQDFRPFLEYLYSDRLPQTEDPPDDLDAEGKIALARARIGKLFGLLRCSLEFTLGRVGQLAAQSIAVAITTAATTSVAAGKQHDSVAKQDAQRACSAAIMECLRLGGDESLAQHFPAVLQAAAAAFVVAVRPVDEIMPEQSELAQLPPRSLAAVLRALHSGTSSASSAVSAVFDEDVANSSFTRDFARLFHYREKEHLHMDKEEDSVKLTDCVISAGSAEDAEEMSEGRNAWPGHRAILAARCGFFEGAFSEEAGFTESRTRHIWVEHLMLPRSVELLLDFVYNGELTAFRTAAEVVSDHGMEEALDKIEEQYWRDVFPAIELLAALPFFQVSNSSRLYTQLRNFLGMMVKVNTGAVGGGAGVGVDYWRWGTAAGKKPAQISVWTSDTIHATGAPNTIATRALNGGRNPAVMSESPFVRGRANRSAVCIHTTGTWFGIGLADVSAYVVEGGSVLGTQPTFNGSLHFQGGSIKLQMRGEPTKKIQSSVKLTAGSIVEIEVLWDENKVTFAVDGTEIGFISSNKFNLTELSGKMHLVAALSYNAKMEMVKDPKAVSTEDASNDDAWKAALLASLPPSVAGSAGAGSAATVTVPTFQTSGCPSSISVWNKSRTAQRNVAVSRNPGVMVMQPIDPSKPHTLKVRFRVEQAGTWFGFGVAEFPAYSLVGGSVLGTQPCFNASYHVQGQLAKLQVKGGPVKKLTTTATANYSIGKGDVIEIEVDFAGDQIIWRKNPTATAAAANVPVAPPPPPAAVQNVQWEWEDDQNRGWKAYDSNTNSMLEAAHSSGQSTLKMNHGFFSAGYTADFTTMKQAKDSTGWARAIRRQVTTVPGAPPPAAPPAAPQPPSSASSPPEVPYRLPAALSLNQAGPRQGLHFVVGLSNTTKVTIIP